MSKLHKWLQKATYIKSAYLPRDFLCNPQAKEVAFWGRSNVGKSSLINAIVQQKNLAKISARPGKTQTINFFELGDEQPDRFLVDLPGYGYAQVDKKKTAHWDDLSHYYLTERSQLQCLFLLIDARRGFMKKDIERLDFLSSYGVPTIIIHTKSDLLKKKQQEALLNDSTNLINQYANIIASPILVSSSKKTNIYDIQKEIWRCLQ